MIDRIDKASPKNGAVVGRIVDVKRHPVEQVDRLLECHRLLIVGTRKDAHAATTIVVPRRIDDQLERLQQVVDR